MTHKPQRTNDQKQNVDDKLFVGDQLPVWWRQLRAVVAKETHRENQSIDQLKGKERNMIYKTLIQYDKI